MNPPPPDVHASTESPDRRALLAGIGGLAAGAFLAGARTVHAGPLTPPAGPVAPTPGPEPRIAINAVNTPGNTSATFSITQPGSYYLTDNIAGEANKHGIEIAASGVTVDLNGFWINNAGLDGISSVAGLTSIRIHSGHIRGCLRGINARVQAGLIIQNVTVVECRADGIAAGPSALVDSCVVERCVLAQIGAGILALSDSVVSNCVVRSSGGTALNSAVTGISVGPRSRVRDCVVAFTRSGNVAIGINVGADGVAENCTIMETAANASVGSAVGVALTAGCSLHRSTFFNNPIAITANARQLFITENNINGNGGTTIGLRSVVGASVSIEGNQFDGLATAIDLAGGAAVVVRNVFRGVTTATANAGAGSVIAPVVNSSNISVANNPFANIVA